MAGDKKRHESAESTDSTAADYVVTPPDGGWGWVVCFACVVCNFVVDGIGYSFGVLLGEFQSAFNATKGKTSLVGSLLCGVYLCTGPIAGALVNRFGMRPVTIAGSFFAGIAFFLSTFSTSIDGLIALYGAAGGFGFGLIYLPAVVAVGYYFEKKRALATGLAVAGSGLGTMGCPPLFRYILTLLDWKYTVTILGCVILQCAVLGTLMRPLTPEKVKSKPRKKSLVDRIRRRKRKESEPPDREYALEKLSEARLAREKALEDSGSETGSIHYSTRHSVIRQNSRMSTTSQHSNAPVPTIIIDSPDCNNITESKPLKNGTKGNDFFKSESNVAHLKRKHYVDHPPQSKGIHHSMSDMLRHRAQELFKPPSQEITKEDFGRPMYRKDIFYSGSVANFHAFRSQPDVTSYVQSITAIPRNLPDEHKSSCPIWMCPCLSKAAQDTLSTMCDFSLLKNPSFMTVSFANIFSIFGLFIPLMFLVDRAIILGIDPVNASFLVSVIGITNTLGRVIWGALADIPWVRVIWINNSTLLLSGVTVLVCPFCNDYTTLIVFAVFFGLFAAGFITLSSSMICDLCGLEFLTTGFGLLSMVRGITGCIAPPVAGMLFDHFGSYDIPFYMAGGSFIISGLIQCILFLPYFEKRRPDEMHKNEEVLHKLNAEGGYSDDDELEEEDQLAEA